MEITINGSEQPFEIYDFTGYEYLNNDMNYTITIISPKKHKVSDLLSVKGRLAFSVNGNIRTVGGYIVNVKALNKDGKYFMYEVKLSSWLEYLRHVTYCRIYENLTSIAP